MKSAEHHQISRRMIARAMPIHFWVGVLLVAVWWSISWLRLTPMSDYYFFPLWFGCILIVDGTVLIRTGTSPLYRSGWGIAWLFVISIPGWWLFELLNQSIQNWRYHPPIDHTDPVMVLHASLAFSTVVPIVLTMTELLRSFRLRAPDFLPAIPTDRRRLVAFHAAGWLMLATMLLWPRYAFPLCWVALLFILDPIVTLLGGRSIGSYVSRKDWTPVINLSIATLICGFFWELWNYYSMPKWTYTVPFVDVAHIFEMPALGYLGYIPFGLEVFALYALVVRLLPNAGIPAMPVSSRDKIDRISNAKL